MAVTTKKLFSATTNATTTVFSPVGIQLNNQDDLDVYVTLSGGTRVLQLRQATASTAQSSHPQVNNTDGLYYPAVSAGTTLYNYQLSTDNNTITFNSALPQGAVVFCERRTRDADSSYTTFASGSTIRATDLNNSSTESNFTAQDGRNKALTIEGVLFRGDQPSTNFITSDHIVAGTIVENDISDNSVTANKIPDDTINSQHYAAGSIDLEHMSANSVDSDQYVDGSIEHVHLANDIIDGDNIQDDVINSEHYVAGSIDTEHIANDQVTYEKIQDVSATNRVLGRDSSGAGVIEEITPSALRTMINVEDGATADQTNAEIKTAYEANANTNEFSDAEQTKLAGIETGATADQTNAEIKTAYEANANTNEFTDAEKTKLANLGSLNSLSDVNTSGVADGKILKYDASASEFIIADDSGGAGGGSSTFTGLSDTPANYGGAANKTLKINSAGNAVEFVTVTTSFAGLTDTPANFTGGAGKVVKVNSNADGLEFVATGIVSADTDPELSSGLDVKTYEINTSTTNGNVKLSPNGTGAIEIRGAGGNDGTLQLNCSANTHGVKIKSPAHSAGASYTLTLPDNDGTNGQALKTDGSGALSFGNVVTSQTEIISLYDQSGTPVQRFLADTEGVTVQGTSGAVSKLMFRDRTTAYKVKFKPVDTLSGNVEFTLPSADGTNGQFLKTDGSGVLSFGTIDLTNLSASNLTSGTIPDDRFPATLPTASAANLTYIPAANINGTLPALNASSLTNLTAANLQGALPAIDGSSLTGIDPTVANGCIYENNKTITSNFTTSTTKNSMSAGPITVDTGVTLTIPSGSTYTIV